MGIVLIYLFLSYFSIIFCLLFLSLSHFHFIHDASTISLYLWLSSRTIELLSERKTSLCLLSCSIIYQIFIWIILPRNEASLLIKQKRPKDIIFWSSDISFNINLLFSSNEMIVSLKITFLLLFSSVSFALQLYRWCHPMTHTDPGVYIPAGESRRRRPPLLYSTPSDPGTY